MFQQILVPVDFTEKNQHSIEIALALAALSHGSVCLLHVIELMTNATFEEFDTFYASLEKQAQDKMNELSVSYAGPTPTMDQIIVYGNRVQEIVRVAQEQAIDLIVMNSHKVNLSDPTHGWGTISYKVSVLAACPVLLVK